MKQTPYPAPDFTLPDEVGTLRSLKDYRGRWVVVYFYPKDDTPGCTVEACAMRDARDELADLGAEIVGISMDDAASHEAFKAKHSLNFTLLTDADGEVLRAYGAWGDNGVIRSTFLVNPESQVVKVYDNVTPQGHGDEVVADLVKLLQG